LQIRLGQTQVGGADIVGELLVGFCADDHTCNPGLVQQPRQRNSRDRDAVRLGDRPHGIHAPECTRPVHGRKIKVGAPRAFRTFFLVAELARQKAARQRTPYQDAESLIERCRDDFALYVFAESKAVEVVPFTEKPSDITNALAYVKPYGKTAFFDALATMPERSRLGRNPSRAIILLSDGIDNASSITRGALAQQLRGISVPIYSLGLREPADQIDNPKRQRPREDLSDIGLLNEVASLTGGKLYLGNTPQQIAEAVSHVEDDLRAQYLIGFAPTGKGAVKYRTISLKLNGRARAVRVRAGYLGTEPPLVAARNKHMERKGS